MVRVKKIAQRLRDLGDLADEYVHLIDEPVPGLIPIGDTGLYKTPDEPADVQDCDRYPDSPYCGGNPFTFIPVGLEPEILIGDCDIGVRFNPILGFIRLPPVNLVYRKPECRTIEPPPIEIEEIGFTLTTGSGDYISRLDGVLAQSASAVHYYVKKIISARQMPGVYGFLKNYSNVQGGSGELLVPWEIFYLDCENRVVPMITFPEYSGVTEYDGFAPAGTLIKFIQRNGTYSLFDYQFIIPPPYLFVAANSDLFSDDKSIYDGFSTFTSRRPYKRVKDNPYCQLNISPPPLKEICCMPQCCPPPDNDLLKVLIKKVNKLSEIIGVDEYPASLPSSLISKDEGFLGNLIPNAPKEIKNLTSFLAWYVERFDEIMGQWEIPIEVKDTDPTTPGAQPKGIKLPNIAEAIAELFTLALQTNINSEVLLNAQTRDLIEGAADKQQNFITYKLIQALTDYLGYKTKDISADMPLSITLNKTRYDEILKESVVKVPVQELDEKFGLEIDLMKFRKAASILDSVYFRKLNPSGDIKKQILDYLLKTHRDVNNVAENKEEFDEFLRQVEEGFGGVTGIEDPTHPYGRNYDQQPRIRDLTNYAPPQGGDGK